MKKTVMLLTLLLAACAAPIHLAKQSDKKADMKAVDLKNMACTYLGAGMDAYNAGLYNVAFPLFLKAVNEYRKDGPPACIGHAYFYLGELYVLNKNANAAVPLFEEAARIGSSVDSTFAGMANEELGKLYFNKSEFRQAKNRFIELVKKNSSHAQGYALLCKAEYQLGEFREAHRDCVRALVLDQKNADARKLIGTLQDIEKKRKELEELEKESEKEEKLVLTHEGI